MTYWKLIFVAVMALAAACGGDRGNVECEANSNCNLGEDGLCTVNPRTNKRWCTYSDATCTSGRRWSDFDVGDGVGGMCVDEELPDAGVDAAPMIDSGPYDAAVPMSFPSCVDLPVTCGSGANADCCDSRVVTGGTFFRDYDAAGDDHNTMNYPATVADFRLDTYEVTVGRFRKFVEAGMGTQQSPPGAASGAHTQISGSGWDAAWNGNLEASTAALKDAMKCSEATWTDSPGTNENLPITCITWYEAFAFCIWDGGYLPTEAEWGYTAAGGDEQRAYPWSQPAGATSLDCTYANYYINDPVATPCLGAANRVGTESPKGDGRYGQADLAGNVWEWMLDVNATPYPLPCDNCANLAPAGDRVMRGGGHNSLAPNLRVAERSAGPPGQRGSTGVRCARAP